MCPETFPQVLGYLAKRVAFSSFHFGARSTGVRSGLFCQRIVLSSTFRARNQWATANRSFGFSLLLDLQFHVVFCDSDLEPLNRHSPRKCCEGPKSHGQACGALFRPLGSFKKWSPFLFSGPTIPRSGEIDGKVFHFLVGHFLVRTKASGTEQRAGFHSSGLHCGHFPDCFRATELPSGCGPQSLGEALESTAPLDPVLYFP